jgi:serine/threonine-protein kinase RsbT
MPTRARMPQEAMTSTHGQVQIWINSSKDVVTARRKGAALAGKLGFKGVDLTVVTMAISDIAGTILNQNKFNQHKGGQVVISPTQHGARIGIHLIGRDVGPASEPITYEQIDDKGQVNRFLPAVSRRERTVLAGRPMDEFEVQSELGKGTMISMTKWVT